MLLAVLSGFALALVAPLLHRFGRATTGWILALLPAGLLVYFWSFIPRIAAGETVVVSYPWAPNLGVNLAFYLDGLSLMFALLITGIGALILIYAGGYLKGDERLGSFFAFLLFFMASMLGVVLSGNLLALFIFWELTSISSFLLIGFTHEREASRVAALQALLITGGGGLALLAGVIMLGLVGGSFDYQTLLNQGTEVQSSTLYLPLLLLVLAGAFTKSAQAPFHFWLPGAMEAPTPVSAYLHSATMVKAGVYLLARLSPVLAGTSAWTLIVTTVGAATMVLGGYMAFYQTDLKRILAYSTISALGTLVLLLGLGTSVAVEAAMVFLLAHALYKGAMFMIAGAVDHETGTRDVERLAGLRKAMPITAAIAALAAVSLGGFGPILSFIGKELLLEASLESPTGRFVLVPAVVLAGALFVLVAGLTGVRPFVGLPREDQKHVHEAPLSMWLGPGVLAVLGLVFGLIPILVDGSIIAPAASAVRGESVEVHLALWHGLNIPLGLSVLSVLIGLGLYRAWEGLRRDTLAVEKVFAWGPTHWYRTGLIRIGQLARFQTRVLQNGYLRNYLLIIILTMIGLVGSTLILRGGLPSTIVWSELRLYEVVIIVLMLCAALAALVANSRLSAVATLGVVGYGVALIYIIYGAPDLAMTQVLTETLTVILFVFIFYYLPPFSQLSSNAGRLRDALVALAAGGVVTLLMLAALSTPPDSQLAPYFIENAKKLGHGSNIVNVILVDFRGLDTMGEITVLAMAAIGVFALLKLRPTKGDGA